MTENENENMIVTENGKVIEIENCANGCPYRGYPDYRLHLSRTTKTHD